MNEFDRFVVHILKPDNYVRYGDDFIMFARDNKQLETMRFEAISFLKNVLGLTIHARMDILLPARHGIHFLGMNLGFFVQHISHRTTKRIEKRLSVKNYSSYYGFIKQLEPGQLKNFYWRLEQLL